MKKYISQATVDRLPLYFRTLQLAEEEGQMIISSEELGRQLDFTPEQVRKDLTSFGQFGRKGIGYIVAELKNHIGKILGLESKRRLAIVGVGHLGAALANYENFDSLGFETVAIFDVDERSVGYEINNIKIYDFKKMDSVVKHKRIDIGVIAVPEVHAQDAADALVEAGIKGIWNFAPVKLSVPESVELVNEDLTIGLSTLGYRLTQKEL